MIPVFYKQDYNTTTISMLPETINYQIYLHLVQNIWNYYVMYCRTLQNLKYPFYAY